MSEDDNSANLEEWIEPELEARVVAWVLGEASAFEAAELERLVEEKPELAIFKRRIEAVHGLVREGTQPPTKLRLSEERRKALLEKLGETTDSTQQPTVLKETKKPSLAHRLLSIAAMLALAGIVVSLVIPSTLSVRGKSELAMKLPDARSGLAERANSSAFEEPSDGASVDAASIVSQLQELKAQLNASEAEKSLLTEQVVASTKAMESLRLSETQRRSVVMPREEDRSEATPTLASADPAPPLYYEGSVQNTAEREISRRQRPNIESQLSAKNDSSSPYGTEFEARPEPNQKPASEALEITVRSGEHVETSSLSNFSYPKSHLSAPTTATGGFYNELDAYQSAVPAAGSDPLMPAYLYYKEDPVVGSNPITAGNRSGSIDIRQSSIDKLLAGASESQSDGFTVDLDNVPTVGDVPNAGKLFTDADSPTTPAFPVTPSTPTEWENRTGEKFEGFINYGSPIQTVSVNALGLSQNEIATENVVNQPIFSTQNASEREITRRDTNVIHAGVAIQKAEEALNDKDVEAATREYQKALELVPEAMKTDTAYRKALAGFGEATMLLADQRIAEGRREDAKVILENYLAANPDYRPALQSRKHLDDPGYYDPTVKPGFIDKVEEVRKLHREAKGFKDTGRYDLAQKRYEQVLNLDNNNIAARRGMEEVTHEQNKYWETSYDQTRSKLLANVQKAWELPYRRFDNAEQGTLEKSKMREAEIREKLSRTIIPQINFSNISVREAVSRLQQEIRNQNPTGGPDSGVNMVLKLNLPEGQLASQTAGGIPGIDAEPQASASVPASSAEDIKINLNLTNVPAQEALKYVTELAGLKYEVGPHAVAIVPSWVNTDVMVTKEYQVPADFIHLPKGGDPANPIAFDAAVGDAAGSGSGISSTATAVDELKAKGVDFPAGASAIYIPKGNRLVVRNTQTNLDLLEALVESVVEEKKVLEANELAATKQPFSTFSLHVSDVSFKLAKDALALGKLPEPDRIRPEEFYNAFDYGDPTPRANDEVACRIEQSAHPLLQQRNLVRIGVKVGASGRSAGQPLRLTLLLDTSGSMEREDRAAAIEEAIGALTGLLGPNDKIAMIGFARKPRLLSDWIPGDQAKKLVEIAANTPSEGGTNMEEALKLAAEIARKELASGAQNRIVLFTDGAANLGDADPEQLAASIQKLRDEGIAFDACGVGAAGLNDEILEALTRKGDGRYYFLNSAEDAGEGFARQLAGAFRPAAENVKVQVRFNPARVGKYRLIGFEEHRLKKEDFRNDKVDAAELAAEESAVAIYQVEPLPGGEGELGDVFVRFREPGTENMVERSWTMRYDAQTPAFDQASATMQLAGSAALLAEKLKTDAVASYVDLQPLYPIVNSLRGAFPTNARVQDLISMFEQTRKILGE